jgi:hypothetical protein
MIPKKYLLCRPRGGLNDTLTQISRCWRYAETFNRELIIDTTRSSLCAPFSDYFLIHDSPIKIHPLLTSQLLTEINKLTCRPACLSGRASSYQTSYDQQDGFIEVLSGMPARFDTLKDLTLFRDYPEELLIYDSCGGGMEADYILPRLSFAADIRKIIDSCTMELGSGYLAVHVRNTDYKTDYKRLFGKIRAHVRPHHKLLVCSDDSSVIDYASSFFPCQILSTKAQIISTDIVGAGHTESDPEKARLACINSFIDLIALGKSSTFFYGTINSAFNRNKSTETGKISFDRVEPGSVSGFSMLAQYLCMNKHLIGRLMSIPISPSDHSANSNPIIRINLAGRRQTSLTKAKRVFIRLRDRLGCFPSA